MKRSQELSVCSTDTLNIPFAKRAGRFDDSRRFFEIQSYSLGIDDSKRRSLFVRIVINIVDGRWMIQMETIPRGNSRPFEPPNTSIHRTVHRRKIRFQAINIAAIFQGVRSTGCNTYRTSRTIVSVMFDLWQRIQLYARYLGTKLRFPIVAIPLYSLYYISVHSSSCHYRLLLSLVFSSLTKDLIF